ncbi:MAG: serine/threonine-protein kinase [Vicinamibacterales bacterium]
MDSAGWQRAKALISAALERPLADRGRFLVAECADPVLRGEVAAILESYEVGEAIASLEEDTASPPSWLGTAPDAEAAGRASDDFTLRPGDVAEHYTIVETIGRGGGGEVYRARDTRLQRDVALKVLGARSAEEGARRLREARAAAQLNHRGIAAIYDVFDRAGRPCIVMEFARGQTLADALRARRFDAAEVVGIGVQIADAVAHAHAAGIVHCDLKPGNIMLERAAGNDDASPTVPEIRIFDFGLARRCVDTAGHAATDAVSGLSGSSLLGLALGTPGYMSPEQLLGLAIDCRSDVFSLGVILHEMCAGRRPFDGADVMSAAVAVLSAPAPDLPRDVPRGLRVIVRTCLARKPDERYATAAGLRDALASMRSPAWRRLTARFRGER